MLALCLLVFTQQPERSLEHELYRAQMYAAEAALRLGEPAVARAWLDETLPSSRGFEWRVHDSDLDESTWRSSVETGYATSIDVHKDGEKFVCGTSSGRVEIRDAHDGSVWQTIDAHADSVSQVRFDAIGRRLVSASIDRTVKVWSYPKRDLLVEFKGHPNPVGGVAFSPDGAHVASCSYERRPDCVVGVLHVWNPVDGAIVRTLNGGRKPLVGLAFSPDGKRIAAGSWDFCVFVWPTEGGDPVRCAMPDEGKYNAVDDVAWSIDSKLVAGASRDGTARVWNAESGALVATLRVHTDAVRSVAFDMSGRTLATTSADGSIGLWNTADWTLRARASGHVDDVEDAAFTHDSKMLLSSSIDRTLRAWDAASTQYGGARMKNDSATYAVRFSPDDVILATCSYDGRIQLWSASAFDLLASWQAHPNGKSCHALDWTSDGRSLVSGSWEPVVRVWDVFTQEETAHIDVGVGTTALDVSADDLVLAVAGGKSVTVWKLHDGSKVHEFKGHSSAVTSVHVAPDSHLCVSTARDGKALVWELDTGKLVHTLDSGEPDATDAAFTMDGRTIVVSGRSGSVSTFSAKDGSKIGVIARSRHGIDHIAISPDGSRVVLAAETSQLVDLVNGGIVGQLRAHVDGTYDVAFDSKGLRLATCSTDKTIAIADARPLHERELERTRALGNRAGVQTSFERIIGSKMTSLSESFDTWRATPPETLKRGGQLQAEWIEYWIQSRAGKPR